MAQWVMSVAGIAILSVLADVILPAGETKKYIKTIIGIVVTLVLVQPLISFAGYGGDFFADSQLEPQQQYVSYVEETQREGVSALLYELKSVGFVDPDVTFSAKNRQFIVHFCENYTKDLQEKALAATENAKLKYPVKFLWNNTE